MKIIVTSQGKDIESLIDLRFGRCNYFVLAEVEDNNVKNISALENKGAIQGHGAGIKAAEQIGELMPDAIITGELGPNASKIINELEIPAYKSSGIIKESIKKLLKGDLIKINDGEEKISSESKSKKEKNIKERIYFPLLDDKGMESEISYHFGHAPFFGVYDISKKKLEIIKNNLDHTNPDKSPIDQIIETINPTTIFAHGIGSRAINLIKEHGLKLKTGNFKTVQEVIDNLERLEEQYKDCGHEH